MLDNTPLVSKDRNSLVVPCHCGSPDCGHLVFHHSPATGENEKWQLLYNYLELSARICPPYVSTWNESNRWFTLTAPIRAFFARLKFAVDAFKGRQVPISTELNYDASVELAAWLMERIHQTKGTNAYAQYHRQTAAQWHRDLHPKLVILDPDGFRPDYDKLWYETLFTEEEYRKRLMYCTIQLTGEPIEPQTYG